jgi:hypothetical protein
MRYIELKKVGQWDTRSVLKQVMNASPRGMLLDEMRKRIKIMDALDEMARISLDVDEEQFKLLVGALSNFPFGFAHKDLLTIIDGVLEASTEPIVKANGVAPEAVAAAV